MGTAAGAARFLWRGAKRLYRCRQWIVLTAALALAATITAAVLEASRRIALVAPAPTGLVYDRHGEFLGEIGGGPGDFGFWPLEELPQRIAAATVAIEDRRFRSHPGVDPLALLRALGQNLSSRRRVSGASTIAMQVARMQSPGPRTLYRKMVEAFTAVGLTCVYERDEILAHYLRIVPYGNRIHGIAYAARRYLDMPVSDLSWAQIAFLAAIPQSPTKMNPFQEEGRARAIGRGLRILGLLHEDGTLSDGEYETARSEIVSLRIPYRGSRPASALHALLRIERDYRAGKFKGNLIRTGLDGELTDRVSALLGGFLESWRPRGAGNAAVLVVDRRTMEALAWVGSGGYFDDAGAGSIDYTLVPRSPGSTLKPFIFARALELGIIAPNTVLEDIHRAPGAIGNSDDRFLGPVLPRVALGNSRNVPAVNLVEKMGYGEVHDLFERLGLSGGETSSREYGLGIAIGTMPVTLEKLVRAYGALANDGELAEIGWIRGGGKIVRGQVLSAAASRQVTGWLADPMARLPTFPRSGTLELPFPVAIKTGTSSNCRDGWAVGYSRRYLVGVWVGRPDYRPMRGLEGYVSSAEVVERILRELHPGDGGGLEDVGFPAAPGARCFLLCSVSGERATKNCEKALVENLAAAASPPENCKAHRAIVVDKRNGLPATLETPEDQRVEKVFLDLPPQYAQWQKQAGYERPPGTGGTPGAHAVWTGAFGDRPKLVSVPQPSLKITSPEAGSDIFRDPTIPARYATISLSVTADPPVDQVVWYVDGKPFKVVDYPYATRWQIAEGTHTFMARVPYGSAASAPVSVSVR